MEQLYQVIVNFQNINFMNCSECTKLEKMIKIIQSDHQFELRKLSEDKSTERALFQVNIQKQVRRWQEKYHKQRQENEQNSKSWLNKIDSITQISAAKVAQIDKKHQVILAQQKQRLEVQLRRYKDTTEQAYLKEISKMRQLHQKQLKGLKMLHTSQQQAIKNQHSKNLRNLQQSFNERQSKLRIEYQSNMLGLRSQKNSQERSFKKTQEGFKEEKLKLINQIYQLKSKICDLQFTVKNLKQKIDEKQDTIQANLQMMAKKQTEFKEEIDVINQKHEKAIEELYDQMNERIKEFYQNELRMTDKYQRTIAKIQQNRQIQLNLYQSNMKQIKNCIESRPSRLEDVEEILSLKQKLAKKEKETEGLQRQLRNYQLQLQNKQDTYNKIFIPTVNSSHLNSDLGILKRKQLKIKRTTGKSISSVRQILHSININPNNLPLLNTNDKKYLLSRNTKIL